MSDHISGKDQPASNVNEWLAVIRRNERGGELFLAYDLARQALQHFPDELALKHRAVLCLASTGATSKAIEELRRLALDPLPEISLGTQLGQDIATLKPRLLKDAALAAGKSERPAALAAAADAYEHVYVEAKRAGNQEVYYPAVNAATLNLLAGNEAAASRLARAVLEELQRWPTENKGFFEIASELEAHLVIGNIDSVHHTVGTVRARVRSDAQSDYRGQAAMLRQLRLIAEAKNLGAELLDQLAPPQVIHYLGHIIAAPGKAGRFPAEQEVEIQAAIEKVLEEADVGSGYGSLAAGADIMFAELLLKRGASLHIVLPFNRDEFIEVSVRPAGDNWTARFHKCFEAAENNGTVRYATDDRYLGDDYLFRYCSELAMGLALLRAQHLSAPVRQIAVWDGMSSGPVGTSADIMTWYQTGLPRTFIPVGKGFKPQPSGRELEPRMERRPHAMLFSDIHGFSGLRDEQLRPFIDVILACTAEVIRRNRAEIRFAKSAVGRP